MWKHYFVFSSVGKTRAHLGNEKFKLLRVVLILIHKRDINANTCNHWWASDLSHDSLYRLSTCSNRLIRSIPSFDISCHGSGGYINAAFLIWSAISSSSLKGNVPLRLQYDTKYFSNHMLTLRIGKIRLDTN